MASTETSSKLTISADYTEGEAGQNLTVAGNVELDNQVLRLAAGILQFDITTNEFLASDRVLLETARSLFRATEIAGDVDTNKATLKQAQFRLKQTATNGSAEQIELDAEQQQITINQLIYTTCPLQDPDWYFEAEQLTVDQASGWGEADNLTVRVGDVPVFYFPWLRFPVDEKPHSGVLFPSISSSDRNGFDYAQPIYWSIADNLDATITPRFLEQRGTQLGAEVRYLTRSSAGETRFDYLDDRQQLTRGDRWSYQINHRSQLNDAWRFELNAAGISDVNYFNDLGQGLVDSNRDFLSREGELSYLTEELQASVRWLRFQPISLPQSPYRLLPQVDINWPILENNDAWQWDLWAQSTRFETDDATALEADRQLLTSNLSYQLDAGWGYLTPALTLRSSHFQQRLGDDSQSYQFNIPSISLDSGLRFERLFKGGKQTLEPRLKLLYTPFEDQSMLGLYDTFEPDLNLEQLFSDNRFAGNDRIGDARQATVGVTSRWFDQGREHWSIAIGRAYYQQPLRVQLDPANLNNRRSSNVISEVTWRPNDTWSLQHVFSYDTSREQTERGQLNFRYEPSAETVVNLAHRFRDQIGRFNEQVDLTFAAPISERWRILGRVNRDLVGQENIETFGGIEYESCCWAVRLVSRRFLSARLDPNGFIIPGGDDRYNTDLLLQFVFKGFASFGQKSSGRLLEDAISDYRDPFSGR